MCRARNTNRCVEVIIIIFIIIIEVQNNKYHNKRVGLEITISVV